MKGLCTFILALIAVGCGPSYTTTGVMDRKLTSTDPYYFLFRGKQADGILAVKRQMVEFGFQIAAYDSAVGNLDTQYKGLAEDERIDLSGMMSAMTGTTITQQMGRISFVVQPIDSGSVFSMRCYGSVKGETRVNAFSSTERSMHDEPTSQGHPLNMKMKATLLKLPGFSSMNSTDYRRLTRAH